MQHGESPVDLDDEPWEEGEGLGWAGGAIAIAALLLFATNAVSLADWIEDMPPSPAQAQAAEAAGAWRDATANGLGAPRAWLHGLWKRAEAARF